jgi:hypothetical protein
MDNREAKFILNAYRPGGQDADDPRFSEALEQARRDPILQRWFDKSITFDAAITEKLSAAPVPSELRESILTGLRVTRPESIRGWKNRWRKWRIAAAVILSATLAGLIWHNTRPAHLTSWQGAALDVISSLVKQESSFDAQSRNPSELLAWLRANHAPIAQDLPDGLGKLASLGCKTFSWNGNRVSVVCFRRPDGGLIHLVTTTAPPTTRVTTTEVRFMKQGQWATATWCEGDKIYMLALEGSLDQLRPYLS